MLCFLLFLGLASDSNFSNVYSKVGDARTGIIKDICTTRELMGGLPGSEIR